MSNTDSRRLIRWQIRTLFRLGRGTTQSGSGLGGLTALHCSADVELSLTFEAQVAALQLASALEVDDCLHAWAAAIFEKEQEYFLEAARVKYNR